MYLKQGLVSGKSESKHVSSDRSVRCLTMSVFTLEAAQGNPVTTHTVDKLCSDLGVTLKNAEKEEYRKLLAVFHDATQALLDMEGMWASTGQEPPMLTSEQTTYPL